MLSRICEAMGSVDFESIAKAKIAQISLAIEEISNVRGRLLLAGCLYRADDFKGGQKSCNFSCGGVSTGVFDDNDEPK